MENNFPGNSNTQKAPAAKKVEKVITGKVIQRKKPVGRRIKEFFFSGEDTKSVLKHTTIDILLPGAKDLVFDFIDQSLEQRFYPGGRHRNRRNAVVGGIFGNATYNAYNRFSNPGTTLRPDPRQQRPAAPSRRGRVQQSSLDEIILETRAEANDVLDQLITIIDQFEVATVADLWDTLGVTGEFTDEKWGWTNLMGADVQRINEGYLLNLPQPDPIER